MEPWNISPYIAHRLQMKPCSAYPYITRRLSTLQFLTLYYLQTVNETLYYLQTANGTLQYTSITLYFIWMQWKPCFASPLKHTKLNWTLHCLALYYLQTANGTIAFTQFSAFVYQNIVGYQNGVPILTSLAGLITLFF